MSSPYLPAAAQGQGSLPLRRLLKGLALLTLVATAVKAVGLSASMPTAEPPSSLTLAGYRISALPSDAPRHGRNISLGTRRQFRLVPLSGEPALTLSLLPVRSRMGRDLNLEAIGDVTPSLALIDKRIVYQEVAAAARPAQQADTIYLGRGPKDTAGSTTRLQTCLTPSGLAAVEAHMLDGELKASGKAVVPRLDLLRVIGLKQGRYECLAVQLESGSPGAGKGEGGSGDRQRQLETVWKELRGVLVRGGG
ncbi:MAG: hypothetical protein WCP63_08750 [Cyanobium sp. ELA712]